MANSGIVWIDTIFNWCVYLLADTADLLGITYEEINVWVFCIIWPVVTLVQTGLIVWFWWGLWRKRPSNDISL